MENSITREFAGFTIRSASVSDMANNVYLLTAAGSDEHVVVDAADDLPTIRALVESAGGGEVAAILTTHRHWDHVRALKAAQEEFGARTVAGEDDASAIEAESGAAIDQTVGHEERIEFAGLRLRCVALRGHTPGSIAYALEDDDANAVILSGDSLFPGGPGKTWSAEDFSQLMDDLEARVFGRFPDDTLVLPGHGDTTALGVERPALGEWRERGW